MIGFFQKQEERLAEKFIRRQYEKRGLQIPDAITISAQAAKMVDEANRITRKRGGNIWTILKDMTDDIVSDLKQR